MTPDIRRLRASRLRLHGVHRDAVAGARGAAELRLVAGGLPDLPAEELPAEEGPPRPQEHLRVSGPFTRQSLSGLRVRIQQLATPWRLDDATVFALGAVATELVVNVVRYADGQGRLHLSRYPGWVFCLVADSGPGMSRPCTAGWQPPTEDQSGGYGLWIARCFSERLTIDSGPLGTVVTAKIPAGAAWPA
ncbi:ATP-binding protein [Catellatospora sp. KI3]|uniref:ATP-binding protein n=1 Tax=Catellatospora sp. KI3 TaxID=3041620 RepID=UPI0024825D25|nr:ATP-binding protein [Catellatospora sp. KI3]MDI1461210.1 ATP-binding protein [Catellatospora sp. KI3]